MAIDIHESFSGSTAHQELEEPELLNTSGDNRREVGSKAFKFSNNLPNLQGWKDNLGDPRVASWPTTEATTRAYIERSRTEASQDWVRGDLGA